MQKIPKLIHTSWINDNILNSKNLIIQNGLLNLINLNKDYKLTIYNDNEVINYIKDNISIKTYNLLYSNTHIVEKLDIWRLLKLYNEGGLYIDLDRLCNIPLSKIINNDTECVLPTCNDYDFSQDFMFSIPRNPIYFETINLILTRRKMGIKHIYGLGPQTYMHAVTKVLVNEIEILKGKK